MTSNIDIDNLKAKIAAVKADIRQEQGMCEGVPSEQLEVQYCSSSRLIQPPRRTFQNKMICLPILTSTLFSTEKTRARR